MESKNSVKIQLCYVFLTICKDSEINKLIKLIYSSFSNEEFTSINDELQNRDNFIKKILPEKLSNNQKLLILTYSFLYISIHNNSLKNRNSNYLLKEFNINNKFIETFSDFFKKKVVDNLIDNRSPIENIFEPTAKTLHFVTDFIFFIFQNGSFIEKQILYGLYNREYEHDLDRKALIALEGVKSKFVCKFLILDFTQFS